MQTISHSPMRSQRATPDSSAFTNLFIRYMDGQIADRSWNQLMNTFDHSGLSVSEKMALARFMNEVIDDANSIDLNIPKPEETEDLMSDIRGTKN